MTLTHDDIDLQVASKFLDWEGLFQQINFNVRVVLLRMHLGLSNI